MDDRFDMYPMELMRDYLDGLGGEPGWQRVLDRYDVEVVVWRRDEALAALLAGSDDVGARRA